MVNGYVCDSRTNFIHDGHLILSTDLTTVIVIVWTIQTFGELVFAPNNMVRHSPC